MSKEVVVWYKTGKVERAATPQELQELIAVGECHLYQQEKFGGKILAVHAAIRYLKDQVASDLAVVQSTQ